MAFCSKCGSQVNEGGFCGNCGATIDPPMPNSMFPGYTAPKKNILPAIIAVVVALAIIISGIFFFTKGNYKYIARSFVSASINSNAEKVISLMPKSVYYQGLKEEYYGDKNELLSDLHDEVLSPITDCINMSDIKPSAASYKLVESEDIRKSDISDLFSDYPEYWKIKAAKTVTAVIKIPQKGEDPYYYTSEITAIKIGISWYLGYFSGWSEDYSGDYEF